MEQYHRPHIGVIGAGRAGSSLARALHAVGYAVAAVWDRTPDRAAALAAATGAETAATSEAVCAAADVTLLAVSDAQIAPFAEQLAIPAGKQIVHLSGATEAAVLAPLANRGAQIGAFHPLQTFASTQAPILPGTVFAIEAAAPLDQLLELMACELGGQPLRLRPEDRPLYHAAALFTVNGAISSIARAAALLAECGLEPSAGLGALVPLLRGAVDSLAALGLPTALTGPIARGDDGTIRRHVQALAERAPDALPLYRSIVTASVPIAAAQGADAERLAAIMEILDTLPTQLAQDYSARQNNE